LFLRQRFHNKATKRETAMAPILATATGVTFIELSEPLKQLLGDLNRLNDVSSLERILGEACESSLFFEEQVNEMHLDPTECY
jgi:hypothetical protein